MTINTKIKGHHYTTFTFQNQSFVYRNQHFSNQIQPLEMFFFSQIIGFKYVEININ